MKIIILLVAVTLTTGCGTNGVPIFLANYYNDRDPCQTQRNGGIAPSWCGGNGGKSLIYLNPRGGTGAPVGYISK